MKRFFVLLLILLLLALPALAETKVYDNAELFSASRERGWETKIGQILEEEQFDVVLVTETSIGSAAPRDYAADFYDYGGFGYGENCDGILLLLVVGGGVGNRDYFILTTGRGEDVFNMNVLYDIEDDILPYLQRSDYASAVDRFLTDVQRYLVKAHPRTAAEKANEKLPMLLFLGAGVGVIATLIMKFGMRTVRRKQNASSYLQKGSFRLTRQQDIYLYTTTTRQRISEPSTRSSGGHSSSHSGGGHSSGGFHGSSGTHHGGHGGKF